MSKRQVVIGKNSITCIRGIGGREFQIEVIDKKGHKWYCELNKKRFEDLPDMTPIDVYDKKGKIHKQFIKKFLFLGENFADKVLE